MEANKMNYTTKYTPGCSQNLRPFCDCYCSEHHNICCRPQYSPQCGYHQCLNGTNVLYFLLGYYISKNCNFY